MRKKYSMLMRLSVMLGICFLVHVNGDAQTSIVYEPVISSGLSAPMEVVAAPGDGTGRLFIVEKGGTVKIWDGTAILATAFLDISSVISSNGERGLLSMAFHPEYAVNGYFFVYYTNTAGAITVSRYKVSSNPDIAEPNPDPVAALITIPKSFSNHNGGHLQFRTEGGVYYLYFATGDGGGSNDPDKNAQNVASFLGKMIRINVDANPITPEIWAIGLRNPFRWSFDRNTGDIWIGDVGQTRKEEINFREGGFPGANYGWSCYEGTLQNTDVTPLCTLPVKEDPVFEYNNPAEGRSVVGGYVYRGAEFPVLQGYYFAADYYSGNLWILERGGNGEINVVNIQPGLKAGISSISESLDGTLYAVVLTENAVYKIVPFLVTPLTLTHFSGMEMDGGYNELKWTTSIEQNIEKFVVEFSANGTDFNRAGEVNASNDSRGATYSYRHYLFNGGKLFYRLHIIEANGLNSYSPIIVLNKTLAGDVKIYPTLISNGRININSANRVDKIQLFNTSGKQVFSSNMHGANGYFSIVLPALQKGVYIIRLTGRELEKNQKIIVQ